MDDHVEVPQIKLPEPVFPDLRKDSTNAMIREVWMNIYEEEDQAGYTGEYLYFVERCFEQFEMTVEFKKHLKDANQSLNGYNYCQGYRTFSAAIKALETLVVKFQTSIGDHSTVFPRIRLSIFRMDTDTRNKYPVREYMKVPTVTEEVL